MESELEILACRWGVRLPELLESLGLPTPSFISLFFFCFPLRGIPCFFKSVFPNPCSFFVGFPGISLKKGKGRKVQNFPELPQKFLGDFPGSSLTVWNFKSNPEVPLLKFTRNLPRHLPDFPRSNRTSPEVSPCLWEACRK